MGLTSVPLPPCRWAGLDLNQPRVMGILNVTPDSFSDGRHSLTVDEAVKAGLAMAADGADIVDVGGESTRPGAEPVLAEVEQDRILPVIERLAGAGIRISVDTRNAATMRAALAAGAAIVNDVSGLCHDPAASSVVAEHGCPVVLMHMRGTPATMGALARYQDVVAEVRRELLLRADVARRAGIRRENIVLDPGFGFAKRPAHSVELLRHLDEIGSLGYPLLIGLSRKGFIGDLSGETVASRRLGGSLAACLFAVTKGASILRVHDVRDTVQAIRVWRTLFE